MTIKLELSDVGILSAISKLKTIQDNFTADVQHVVEILADEGAMRARVAYGGMTSASSETVSESQAKIVVSGGDTAIIAEFGAGYGTM